MIKLSTTYVQSVAPDASYPQGGSFKNAATPESADGTPLERQWGNDIYGFFEAALAAGGVVASGVSETASASDVLTALRNLMWSPGDLKNCAYGTPGPGWLECNGGTIGNAVSGSTARANADTLALFTVLWPLTSLAIYTSAGTVSVRGANAAADFAANKRLKLPDFRGDVLRGWDHGRGIDPGRLLGSEQTDAFESHQHHEFVSGNTSNPGDNLAAHPEWTPITAVDTGGVYAYVAFGKNAPADCGVGEAVGDTETRMRNGAAMIVIKL